MPSGTKQKYIIILCLAILLAPIFLYSLWTPGSNFTDGRHDRKRNGIWIQHGWMGDDSWFIRNRKKDRIPYFRNPEQLKNLAVLLRRHHITDIFPHLCPASPSGEIPAVDPEQTRLFLKTLDGFRVMPWIGGLKGVNAFPEKAEWRKKFAESVRGLMTAYPQFSGVHINIEPCPSGDKDFLLLLEDVRRILPEGKILSVASFPPPLLWHPFKEVHWDEEYYHQVSQRTDQIAVMMYDTALRFEKIYQYIIASWTQDVLDWSKDTDVLLGLPAYKDEGVGYHYPQIENLKNAIPGIHSGLNRYKTLPKNYQGISLYSEWEMEQGEWQLLREHYLK